MTNNSNIFVFLLLALIGSLSGKAQVFTGGNVSVSYDKGVYVDIAPLIGYRLDQVNAGVSPLISYKQPDNSSQSFFSMGGRVFGQYHLIENIFAHGEFQALNTRTFSLLDDGARHYNRIWTLSLPVGAGYETRISDKARVQASVLYDLLQDKNNPNNMPAVRGGIFYDL